MLFSRTNDGSDFVCDYNICTGSEVFSGADYILWDTKTSVWHPQTSAAESPAAFHCLETQATILGLLVNHKVAHLLHQEYLE